jgi:hypothetical protein
MKKKITSLMLATVVVCMANAQKITLKLTAGQKISSSHTTSSVISVDIMGQSMESTNSLSSSSTTEVKSTSAEGSILDMVITKMKVSASQNDKVAEYDSEKKDNDATLEEQFAKLVNKVNTVKINANGAESANTDASANEKNEGFSALSVEKQGPSSLFISSLFDQDIKQGSSWTTTEESKGTMSTKKVNNFTIDKVENDIIYISNNAVQKIDGTVAQMGMEMPITGTNIIKASYQVDAKTGLIKQMESEVNGTNTITAQGMEVPVNTKITVKTVNQ